MNCTGSPMDSNQNRPPPRGETSLTEGFDGPAGAVVPAASDPAEHRLKQAYELHAPLLLRYALMHTRDAEVARDAVQESFLRYFQAPGAIEPVTEARTWLLRSVAAYLSDEARLSEKRTTMKSASHIASPGGTDAGEAGLPLLVRRALSPRELQCVELRTLGLSYDEVASSLGISPGTVASLMSRAAQKLRRLLPRSPR